jgi:hypothetical protein
MNDDKWSKDADKGQAVSYKGDHEASLLYLTNVPKIRIFAGNLSIVLYAAFVN